MGLFPRRKSHATLPKIQAEAQSPNRSPSISLLSIKRSGSDPPFHTPSTSPVSTSSPRILSQGTPLKPKLMSLKRGSLRLARRAAVSTSNSTNSPTTSRRSSRISLGSLRPLSIGRDPRESKHGDPSSQISPTKMILDASQAILNAVVEIPLAPDLLDVTSDYTVPNPSSDTPATPSFPVSKVDIQKPLEHLETDLFIKPLFPVIEQDPILEQESTSENTKIASQYEIQDQNTNILSQEETQDQDMKIVSQDKNTKMVSQEESQDENTEIPQRSCTVIASPSGVFSKGQLNGRSTPKSRSRFHICSGRLERRSSLSQIWPMESQRPLLVRRNSAPPAKAASLLTHPVTQANVENTSTSSIGATDAHFSTVNFYQYAICKGRVTFSPGYKVLERSGSRILDVTVNGQSHSFFLSAAIYHPHSQIYAVTIGPILDPSHRPSNFMRFDSVQDLSRLPYEDNFFDLISARRLYSMVQKGEWKPCLKEFLRVLRPGGYLEVACVDVHYVNRGPKVREYNRRFSAALLKNNVEPNPSRHLTAFMNSVGFVAVHRVLMGLPIQWGGRLSDLMSRSSDLIIREWEECDRYKNIWEPHETWEFRCQQIRIECLSNRICRPWIFAYGVKPEKYETI